LHRRSVRPPPPAPCAAACCAATRMPTTFSQKSLSSTEVALVVPLDVAKEALEKELLWGWSVWLVGWLVVGVV
jgi:hypothetical protein